MSEQEARKLAAELGVRVGKRERQPDGTTVIAVGSSAVWHDGRGGSFCWRIRGIDQYQGRVGVMLGALVRQQAGVGS